MLDQSAPPRTEPAPAKPGPAPRTALAAVPAGDAVAVEPIHVIAPVSTAPSAVPALWQALVSDGHVRAARLRRMQPWIVAAGIVMLWIGFWIASRAPAVRHDTSAAAILQERIGRLHQRAQAAVTALPRLAPGLPAAQLPPVAEVAEVVAQTLQSLDKSGELPAAAIDFLETNRAALWKGEWTAERVQYLRSADVVLVAATVNAGSATRAQPMRWMGAFKKFGDRWQYASLAGANFFAPREYPVAAPAQIGLTLAPLLPDDR